MLSPAKLCANVDCMGSIAQRKMKKHDVNTESSSYGTQSKRPSDKSYTAYIDRINTLNFHFEFWLKG